MNLRAASLLVAFVVASGPRALPQNNLRVGTWTLNVAKSKYDPGPPPRSETRTYEAYGDGLKFATDRVEADGEETRQTWAAHYDGQDNAYVGSPAYDTIALKRVDDFTIESVNKRAGQVVQTNRSVISRDGKTLTITADGYNADGKRIHYVAVFEKQ